MPLGQQPVSAVAEKLAIKKAALLGRAAKFCNMGKISA